MHNDCSLDFVCDCRRASFCASHQGSPDTEGRQAVGGPMRIDWFKLLVWIGCAAYVWLFWYGVARAL